MVVSIGIFLAANYGQDDQVQQDFNVDNDDDERKEAVAAGEITFFDQACWRCHTLGDRPLPGNQDIDHLGPDLAGVGNRLEPEEITQSIADPNAVIADPKADHTDEAGNSFMPPMAEGLSEKELQHLVLFLSQSPAVASSIDRVINVTEATFDKEALQSDRLVLLDFWAEWCLPCLELEPILIETAAEFGDQVKVCKINVDENPGLVAEYVPDNMFPALLLMRDGKLLDRRYGTDPKVEPAVFLRSWIGSQLDIP